MGGDDSSRDASRAGSARTPRDAPTAPTTPFDSEVTFGSVLPAALPVIVVSLIWAIYVAFHAAPVGEYGLYAALTRSLLTDGYPSTVAHYQPGGVPFAYPPLGFAIAAAVQYALSVSFEQVAVFLPGAYLVPTAYLTYRFAREVFPTTTPWVASVSATIAIGGVQTMIAQMMADGVISAPALLAAVASWLFAVRAFRDGNRRSAAVAGVLFGLALLVHPTVAFFSGLTTVALYLTYDRTLRGLLNGVLVAGVGLLVAAPWVIAVVRAFGTDPFAAALAARFAGGGPSPVETIQTLFALNSNTVVQSPFLLWTVAVLGGFYCLVTERWFPVIWMGIGLALSPKYGYMAEAFLAGPLIVEAFPALLARGGTKRMNRVVPRAFVVLFVLSSVATAAVFAGLMTPTVTPEHRQAMNWIQENTDEEATLVAAGPGSSPRFEVLPYYTNRSIKGGYWGAEWTSADAHRFGWRFTRSVEQCTEAACIRRTLRDFGLRPDYVYVPTAEFRTESVRKSSAFDVVYENEGVILAETNSSAENGTADVRLFANGDCVHNFVQADGGGRDELGKTR